MSIYILIGFAIVFSEILTYKIIKKIDKKERKKLYDWELDYIKKIKETKVKKNDIDNNSNNDNSTNSVSSETK